MADEPEKEKSPNRAHLEHFYQLIISMPLFVEKEKVADQGALLRFEEIQLYAKHLLEEFDQDKKTLLTHFDGWLLPAAREVLEDLSKDTENLKNHLDTTLQGLRALANMDWELHGQSWKNLYQKWKNQQALTDAVLKVVSERARQLIDRDIKIIDDYRSQSLGNLSPEQEEFKDVENRLHTAIEEPLKFLVDLKQPPQDLSVSQTGDWIAAIHQNREEYFDNVLMKIDSVVKDIVYQEDLHDLDSHAELEGEMLFMEHEIRHIQETLAHLDRQDEREVEFVKMSLNGLKEHLADLNFAHAPRDLKKRAEGLAALANVLLSTFLKS